MNDTAASDRSASTRWLGRIALFPLTRILVYVGGIGAVLWLQGLAAGGLRVVLGTVLSGVANVVLAILAIHFAYRGIARLLERRSAVELSLSGAPLETGAGALVGAGCLTVTVGMVAALGYYDVQGIGAWATLATAFGIAATSGYIEEVIFRGVIFRIVEESLGSWLALAISVALFGLAHLGNPNATLYGAAAIGIEAGVLLGAAYMVTRRLWFAIGVHFGWNFMQAGVFGPQVSGRQVDSLLQSRLSGPDLLSGGALGLEGSLFAVTVCLLVAWFGIFWAGTALDEPDMLISPQQVPMVGPNQAATAIEAGREAAERALAARGRLQRCHDENPELWSARRITLRDGFGALRLALWDEERGRLISFAEHGWRVREAALEEPDRTPSVAAIARGV